MAEQQRLALIFAVDEYAHPDLQRLSAPVADANALADTLGRPELGGFDAEICHNLSSAEIAEKLEDFLIERKSGDLALLHFSGHGLKDESGSLYLAARNTIPTRLASTAVDATLINLLMRRSRARSIVLFLDCCYGGAFERGMVARADGSVAVREQFSQDRLGGGRGRVVVTASSAVQYAFEGSHLADQERVTPSLFTGAVVEGIRSGDADRDADGLVSLGELYDYVYERVLEQSPHQTPSKWEYGLEGDLIISKSPRRRLNPADLPDELITIINHPYPVARRGAVDELARLAAGADLPLAVAAVQELSRMRDDDSRSIATSASSAIDALAIGVSAESLAFGDVPVGKQSPELTCQLLGPPLVEAADITTDQPAFTVRLAGRTIHVSVLTEHEGDLAGSLHVGSAVGDLTIPLTASVRTTTEASMVPNDKVAERAVDDAALGEGDPEAVGSAASETLSPDEIASLPSVQTTPGDDPPSGDQKTSTTGHVVGPVLTILGALLVVAGFFAPWSTTFISNSIFLDADNAFVVLLLPSSAVVAGSLLLLSRREEGLAFGAVCGGFLTSLNLFLLLSVVVGIEQGSWQAAPYIELIGLVVLLSGAIVTVRGSRRLSTAATWSRDGRSLAGLGVVLVGVAIAVVDLIAYSADVQPWMLVFPTLLTVIAVPIPLCRFGVEQGKAAVSTITVFVILWTADMVSNVSVHAYPWISDTYWWITILAALVMISGCAISQLPRGAEQPDQMSVGAQ